MSVFNFFKKRIKLVSDRPVSCSRDRKRLTKEVQVPQNSLRQMYDCFLKVRGRGTCIILNYLAIAHGKIEMIQALRRARVGMYNGKSMER